MRVADMTPEQAAEWRSRRRLVMRRYRAKRRAREQAAEAEQSETSPPAAPPLPPPPVGDDPMSRIEAREDYQEILARLRAEREAQERQRAEERAARHPMPEARDSEWRLPR